jgi:hypothetical protein
MLAIPISSPGGQVCAAHVMINAPVAASAQANRRIIIDRLLDFSNGVSAFARE